MSDQQPPSGLPEYLDSGHGSPLRFGSLASAPRRLSRRTTWWVGGGVVGVLALGAGAWAAMSFFQQGPQPAEALPASTIAYVGVDLDPSGGQKIDAFRTLDKFPAFKDKVGIHSTDDLRRKIGDAIITSTGCHLSFGADIDPWLGDRAAVAAVDLGRATPATVFVVQVKDDGRAKTGLHTLTTCGDARSTALLGYDVHDGWAVLARSQQVADTVVAETNNGSLADDPTYQRWTKAVGDSGVVNMYAAPAAGVYLADRLGSFQSSLGGLGLDPPTATATATRSTSAYSSSLAVTPDPSSGLEQTLKNFRGAAATIRFTGGGLELATASDPGLSQSSIASDQGGAVVSRLPDDTAAALGLGLRSGWFTQLADKVATAEGRTPPQLLRQLSRQSGLDLPTDVETLLGHSAALSLGKDFDYEAATNSPDDDGVPVALTIQGDPSAIAQVLAKIRARTGGGRSAAALASDSSGDLVAVGPSAAYRTTVLAGGHLGDTAAFRGVVPDVAHTSLVLYVDVDGIEKALAQIDGGDHQVTDNVAPLQAFGFSAWIDGGVARTSLRISTH